METIAPFRIGVCGIDDLAGHCESGVSHVLSILDPDWPVPEAFGTFGEHARLELRFHDAIEPDMPGVRPPDAADVERMLRFGRDLLAEPPSRAHLLVHCHAGISRSTAAMALILAQAVPDRPAAEILDEIVRLRPKAWPNLRIVEMGDALLGRNGALVAATGDLYRAQLGRFPRVATMMRAAGRGREVDMAEQRNDDPTRPG